MDNGQLVLFEELKDCLEDLSGVDGDGLGEGEEISFGELDESGIEEEPSNYQRRVVSTGLRGWIVERMKKEGLR